MSTISLPASSLNILRRNEVEKRTGLSRSTIYHGVKTGTFPAPIALGARAVGWLETDIDSFLTACVEKSRPIRNKVAADV